ncbi:hypothetical protein LE197_36720 [Pseudomonas sp. PS1(2021)]|uniref:hypothetical protein n=1 Tax=Pseudomonas sp. PS1(2021) TaxID=2866282 RepID=UPI001CF0687D|nr:hypothetical protein [Pseudomonas sp. PS1(2021)]UCM28363.1 hypothetical protein LE197_36720 [Pseudomonas sp. PS1(2021)]
MSDEALLDERRDNLLAAILGDERLFGLAVLDITSGRFSVQEIKAGKPCWPNWSAQPGRADSRRLAPGPAGAGAAAYVAARHGT